MALALTLITNDVTSTQSLGLSLTLVWFGCVGRVSLVRLESALDLNRLALVAMFCTRLRPCGFAATGTGRLALDVLLGLRSKVQ